MHLVPVLFCLFSVTIYHDYIQISSFLGKLIVNNISKYLALSTNLIYNTPLVGIYVSLGGFTQEFSRTSTPSNSVTFIIGISSL